MAIAVIGSYETGVPMAAVAGGVTALCCGLASQQGFYRTRVATMVATTFSMAVCVAIGSLTVGSPLLSVLAIAVCGYVFGIMASLGPVAALVGVWAAMTLAIFGHFPLSASATMTCVLSCLCSGAAQIALLVATWPLYRYPEERRALSALYRGLAQYARSGNDGSDLLRQSEQIGKVRAILADPQPFGRDIEFTAVQTLLDEAVRIRGTLACLPLNDNRFAGDRSIAADALDDIAASIEQSREPSSQGLQEELEAERSDATARALFGQIRAARRIVSTPLRGVALRPSRRLFQRFPDLPQIVSLMRQNMSLHTAFGRHALRFALVLALARAIEHVLPFSRGYWITLTVAIVLKPDFTTTFVRGIARIAGTLLGVVFATAVVVAFPNAPSVDIALTVACAVISITFLQINFPIYDVGMTCYVVFILALIGQPQEAAIVNRLLATVAGGGLAMLSYFAWPMWESARAREQIVASLDKLLIYMGALFDGLANPLRRDVAALDDLRSEVWRARAAANESLERMLSEPRRTHEISHDQALGIMAAVHRVEFANLKLWNLYSDRSTPALPQVVSFWQQVEGTMSSIVATLSGKPPAPMRGDALRDAYDEMKTSLRGMEAPAVHLLLESCDRIVDSINTMVNVIG